MFINKSDGEPARIRQQRLWKGAESGFTRIVDGRPSSNGSSDGKHVVRVVPCAPKVPHAPEETRSRTTAEMRRGRYFVEGPARRSRGKTVH